MCIMQDKGQKAGFWKEAVVGGLTPAEARRAHRSVQYWGAAGALCWNHLVSPSGAGPRTRVSSTCLDPADSGHKFTQGRMGMKEAGRTGCRVRGQIAAGEGYPREEAVCAGLEVVGGSSRSSTDPLVGGLRPPAEGSWKSNRLQAPRRECGHMLRDSTTLWQEALTPGVCSQVFGGLSRWRPLHLPPGRHWSL